MEVTPLKDNLIVEPIKKNNTQGGIIIGEEDQIPEGKVIKIGPEVTSIKAGDIVVFNEWAITKYEDLYIIKEEEVLCLKR